MTNRRKTQTRQTNQPRELAAPQPSGGRWAEIGTGGLNSFGGYIQEAYTSELHYPGCIPLFDRMYQADPEVAIVRYQTTAWGGSLGIDHVLPDEVEKPTDDDKRALEFSYSVAEEIEGGGLVRGLTDGLIRAPFYGWGLWNTPPGLRNPDFKPPNNDPWRSTSNDGLIGYRRLSFRRYSSFLKWELDDYTGRAVGMWQNDSPNPQTLIPFDSSLHLTFGDNDNPEGLGTAIALYRLEGIKRAYETIMGIGFEHSAGHLKVKSTDQLSTEDKTEIRRMARAITSAQPGNYIALPEKLEADMMDVPFAAGTSLLEVVRYYSILKLALMGMGWLANASGISGVGSFANVKDGSEMAVLLFNAMAADFVRQMDEQLWARLFSFQVNKDAFPNLTARPRLKLIPLDKDIPLMELGQLATAFSAIMPLGDDDFLALRKKSGFLPNILPGKEEHPEPEPTTPETDNTTNADDSLESDGTPELDGEMSAPMYSDDEKERFWEFVKKGDDCWTWQGAKNEKGYGIFSHNGATVRAHRVAWEMSNGVVPRGKHVLHKCDNPPCCRPGHLFVGSNQDNVDDRVAKGEMSEFGGETLYFTDNGNLTTTPMSNLAFDKELVRIISNLATPAKRLQTLEEKIKDMPDYLQDDINGLAAEFGVLRKVSRREGVARLDEITDEAWDNAVVESLEEGE